VSRLPLNVAIRAAPAELRVRATARVERLRPRQPFQFDGQDYDYLVHHYNTTWRNERAVEIPLATRVLQRRPGARMLEVGNVLRNYLAPSELPPGRVVVDRYEPGEGVLNADVVDYDPSERFDLVVSISTLEHVGRDEEPKDPTKVLAAIERMHGWLAPGGELFVTVPLGYHPELDERMLRAPPLFDRLDFLRRVSADNRWVQADAEEVRGTRFASPFPAANALAVARSAR
jgi:SAM-dependent methyltransferase